MSCMDQGESPSASPSPQPTTEEDESVEVGETLRQLQHTHSRLRQEKEALEAYFIALESESERRLESSDSLKERNHQLSAVTRRLTRLIRQAQAHIRELRMRLLHTTTTASTTTAISSSSSFSRIAAPSSSLSASVAALSGRVKDGKTEGRGKGDDENDEPLTYEDLKLAEELLGTARSSYDETIERIDVECADLRARLADAKEQLGQRDREVHQLQKDLEQSREALHRATVLADAAYDDAEAAAAAQARSSSPPSTPLAEVIELRQKIKWLEEDSNKHTVTVRRYEEMARLLQDELDVARQQLEEAQRDEQANAANELSFEEELARSDQSEGVQRRLTLEEQRMVICQLGELKIDRECMRDEIRTIKPAYGLLLQLLEQTKRHADERDKICEDVLLKPPGRGDRKRLLQMLQKTRIGDIDMQRFQTL